MSQPDSPATTKPQVESIWLTRTSVKPIWLAFFMLCTLGGLFSFWPLMVVGAVVSLGIAFSWALDARAESDELPLH